MGVYCSWNRFTLSLSRLEKAIKARHFIDEAKFVLTSFGASSIDSVKSSISQPQIQSHYEYERSSSNTTRRTLRVPCSEPKRLAGGKRQNLHCDLYEQVPILWTCLYLLIRSQHASLDKRVQGPWLGGGLEPEKRKGTIVSRVTRKGRE